MVRNVMKMGVRTRSRTLSTMRIPSGIYTEDLPDDDGLDEDDDSDPDDDDEGDEEDLDDDEE